MSTFEKPNPSLPPETPLRSPGLRLAILSGLLLWLACPPIKLWPLAWVAVAPLLLSITRARSLRQAAWRGYAFGWAYLGVVWYWTGLTIVNWTGSAIGWVAWFALTTILAGFYAAYGGVAWWLTRRTSGGGRVVALAGAWVIMEWARTLGTLTMPWAQLSYTQYLFQPVLQIAEFTGAYGVSFLLMLVNAGLAAWWPYRKERTHAHWLWASLTLTVFVCLFGWARLIHREEGRPITVAVLQGNFKMRESWRDLPYTLRTFADLTRQAAQHDPSPTLMVWSESAAPGDALNNYETRNALSGLARYHHAAIVVGSRVSDPMTESEANSSLLFPPDGSTPQRYDKRQLVPFGEFIPFRGYLPPALNEHFHFFDTDVTRGPGAVVLRYDDPEARKVVLGPFICYESMYPTYPRQMTLAGANLLITQSNDAWFQSRAAMEQHLSAVVLRAIENRRDIARSTTTGLTCLIDEEGHILQCAPTGTPYALIGTLHLHDGLTLYARLGDWFVGFCGLLIVGAFWQGGRERRARQPAKSETPSEETA